MLPNARFKELLSDIEPKRTIRQAASAAHISVRDHLWRHPQFSGRLDYDFLAGSYARYTAVRPCFANDLNSRPDVDVYLKLRYGFTANPRQILVELKDALDQRFHVERINRRSVRVNTGLVDVDVVPLINSGNGFKIPDRISGNWSQTNPMSHYYWSQRINGKFENRFKPLVKLIKWWRLEHFALDHPKGFSLEILAAQHAPSRIDHYGTLFTRFLQELLQVYGPRSGWQGKPILDDPAVPGNDILSRVSKRDWSTFMTLVAKHAEIASLAQTIDDERLEILLWRLIFGERFGRGFIV
ncbi:nucleotidyltransferase [Mesorhizobium sp. M0047]|uniref:SMODS domain-containing nucleotidyltransferase n=1 Tax=Mesorhizobium sp. M0047 TaxID=2956859 RepID=UPI00333604A7